jgi:site-specific DNA-methyltransferase (adenine-specific)
MDDLFNTPKPKIATSITLLLGECLERMREIPDGSVDMVMADLPYGTTACKWDSVIPFEPLWEAYRRVTKKNAAIVLTATQPFTSVMITSNINMFKYCWTWEKGKVGGFTSAKLKPLKLFEDVVVFSEGATANCSDRNMPYYPQGLVRVNKISRSSTDKSPTGYARPSQTREYLQEFSGYPNQLLPFPLDRDRQHPTQKPVALMEYLIKTYTNPGELVLDNTMGSGTTGVACINTGRNFIGIERDEGYFKIAQARCGITTE